MFQWTHPTTCEIKLRIATQQVDEPIKRNKIMKIIKETIKRQYIKNIESEKEK